MNHVQQMPYLRTQRYFPNKEVKEVASEMDQAYIDIAEKVNARTIGLFAENYPSVTGESYYLAGSNRRQQTLREVYTFTSTANIPHNIDIETVTYFTDIFAGFWDGNTPPKWQLLPYVDVVSATNQISFNITTSDIVFTVGAGSPPTITSGIIILTWLSEY